MIEKLFFLMLLTVAVVFSPRAGAVMNLEPMVPGLSGGVYKPLSVPALTGANFSATGQVLVNGRFVPIPGYIPPAPTATQAARTSLWLNPWLVGASLLAWAGDAGLHSDSVDGWKKTTSAPLTAPWVQPTYPNSPDGIVSAYAMRSNQGCPSPSSGYVETAAACINGYGAQGGGCQCCIFYPEHYNGQNQLVPKQPIAGYSTDPSSFASNGPEYPPEDGCPAGYSGGKAGTDCNLVDPMAAGETTAPATQADFEALPPPPATALAELAPQVGVPVDDPVYSPADVAIGEPYTRADGSTAQPRAKISPAGNGEVYVDTYKMPLTDSTGAPVANPAPQDTQEPQPPAPTQCDKYPNSLGCANLDSPLSEDLQTQARGPSLITPVSLGGSGSCPAPLTATVMGHVVEMSFDPLCQYANALRPLVLALAWLSAGVLFIGGVRNG